MGPPVLDEASFDRFVSDNDTVVIAFVGQDTDAASICVLASAVLQNHPGVAFAQVHRHSRKLFEQFALAGTATAIFRDRVGMYLEAGLPAVVQLTRMLEGVATLDMKKVRAELELERAARESLAVHRVCPATRRGKPE
jgi:hypothetical protein